MSRSRVKQSVSSELGHQQRPLWEEGAPDAENLADR